jgi:hypothetical protein
MCSNLQLLTLTLHKQQDLGESLSIFDKEFYIYPLWLCPMRIPRAPNGHTGLIGPIKGSDDDMVCVYSI